MKMANSLFFGFWGQGGEVKSKEVQHLALRVPCHALFSYAAFLAWHKASGLGGRGHEEFEGSVSLFTPNH